MKFSIRLDQDLAEALREIARISDSDVRSDCLAHIVADIIPVDHGLARAVIHQISDDLRRLHCWLDLALVSREESDLEEAAQLVLSECALPDDASLLYASFLGLIRGDFDGAIDYANLIGDGLLKQSCLGKIIQEGRLFEVNTPGLLKLIEENVLQAQSTLEFRDLRSAALFALETGNIAIGLEVLTERLGVQSPYDEDISAAIAHGYITNGTVDEARALLPQIKRPQLRYKIFLDLAVYNLGRAQ